MRYKPQDLPTLSTIHKIFFVGIKGVGVCPLALIAKQAGFTVAGSDIAEEFITDKSLREEGIQIFEGFDTFEVDIFFNDTPARNCLVVTTGAHGGFDNPQVVFAKKKGITVLTQGQALGVMMEGELFGRTLEGIAVAGAHGKTTITSLLASTLTLLDKDPSYSIGTGEVFPIGAPGHYGKGELFIAEADEYASEPVHDKIPKFLYLKPDIAIFNNIDFDHPDLFSSVDDVFDAFVEFAHMIQSGGTLFVNGDDARLQKLIDSIHKDIKVKKYGEGDGNDYIVFDIKNEGVKTSFSVRKGDSACGEFAIHVPGSHNARNALAVVSVLLELGYSSEDIKRAMGKWRGSKRRLELVGRTKGGAMIFDDYGHHPEEIATTIRTLKEAYPNKRLIAIFQSHTYSRTRSLLKEFADSFKNADKLILLPVFASQRDTETDALTSEEITDAFKAGNTNVHFLEKFSDVVEYVDTKGTNEEEIILTIGAGDVYKIGYKIKEERT